MVDEGEARPQTRRTLLGSAGALTVGGSLAALAGCGARHAHTSSSTTAPSPAAQTDIELLNGILDLEHRGIALYTVAVPLLSGRAHAAAKLFLQQELSHAATLMGYIAQVGGKSHKQRSNYDFGQPQEPRSLVALIAALEKQQIAAYLNALPQLSTPLMRASMASVLANDAQHLAVMQLLLGRNPVPTGFVTGLD